MDDRDQPPVTGTDEHHPASQERIWSHLQNAAPDAFAGAKPRLAGHFTVRELRLTAFPGFRGRSLLGKAKSALGLRSPSRGSQLPCR
jgi:hypothetical protein